MSHNTLFKVVATVIALSAGLAFKPVGAQSAISSENLVTTECGSGQQNRCGSKPAQITCNFGISVQPSSSLWGFSISFGSCTSHGEVGIYKDFVKGGSGGACVQTQRFPADRTRTSREDGGDFEDYNEAVEESC